jgi:signal peptidase I
VIVAAATGIAAIAVAGAWLRYTFMVITVRGVSMVPLLHDGERVLVRRVRNARLGQMVLLRVGAELLADADGTGIRKADSALLVKRLVAVAGHPLPAGIPGEGDVVPPGTVVVLGGNDRSMDSRLWGCIPASTVVGVVRTPDRETGTGTIRQGL